MLKLQILPPDDDTCTGTHTLPIEITTHLQLINHHVIARLQSGFWPKMTFKKDIRNYHCVPSKQEKRVTIIREQWY